MASVGVDVQLRGDAGSFERDEVAERVFDTVDVIVFVLEKKGWRSLGSDMGADVGIEFECGFGEGEVAGV